jgi:hypothetical protein
MSTRLRIIENPWNADGTSNWPGPEFTDPSTDHILAGCMWREPDLDTPERENWEIVLPHKAGSWHTNMRASGTGNRWDVTGEPPNITVNPSINAGDGPGEGNWHGWIKDGEMTP